MINKFIASVSACVELRGRDILRVESSDEESVTYRLAGFEDRPLALQDYRIGAHESASLLLDRTHPHEFTARFNGPSSLLLFTGTHGEVLVQLMETTVPEPLYMFWINAGEQETLPLTHYSLFQDERRLPDRRKVFVSLHKRLYRGQIPADRGPAQAPSLLTQIIESDRSLAR